MLNAIISKNTGRVWYMFSSLTELSYLEKRKNTAAILKARENMSEKSSEKERSLPDAVIFIFHTSTRETLFYIR